MAHLEWCRVVWRSIYLENPSGLLWQWRALKVIWLRGCLHEKTRTGVSFIPTWLFYFVSRLHDDWVISHMISLFEGTVHVDKMHVWFKIANMTHALPVPVYRQTDFTPKRMVVSCSKRVVVLCLHDTVARFCTRVKFSPRYKNRGELAPGWLTPAWNLWCYHVNKYRAMRGNWSELTPGQKSPRCQVNTPHRYGCTCSMLLSSLCKKYINLGITSHLITSSIGGWGSKNKEHIEKEK